MTLRPLKVEFRFAFDDYLICSHRDEIIGCIKKLPKDFIIKIKKYPITAFGYSFNLDKDLSNPKFDRTDVIKALDFWIEHWVYQNKKDYILEGTVNKDFELTVRELIETREAVLKMPADTQFVRQKIRFENKDTRSMNFMKDRYYYRFQDGHLDTNMRQTEITKYSKRLGIEFPKPLPPKQIPPDQIIEFTENVLNGGNTSASTVDQFCYVVRRMTYKEYMKQLNNPVISKQNGILSDIIQVQMDLREERDDGPRFNFVGLDDELSSSMWGARHSDGSSMPADGTNPNNWVVVEDGPNTFRIINTDGVNIAGGFNTRLSAELYLINVREHFLPSEVSVPESIESFEIRGPDHILHSNLHPGINPSSTESALAGKRIKRIDIRIRKEGEPL